jgi:signal transduction histidine kinase
MSLRFKVIFGLVIHLLFLFLTNISAQTSSDTLIARAKKQMGTGNYAEGLKLAFKAFEVAEKSKDKTKMADAAIQLGTALYMNKQPKKEVLHYFFICRKYSYEDNIEILKPRINHNIGSIYIENKQPDSAIFYFTEVLNLLEGTDKYYELSKTHAVMAELYFINLKDQYEKAYPHVLNSEKYARLSGNPGDLAFALMKKGLYYYNKKDFKNSYPVFKQAQHLYDSLKDQEGKHYSYRLVADSYAGQYDTNILHEYERYFLLKDTLFNQTSAQEIAKYKTDFETIQRENENKFLQQENEIKEGRIARNTNIILILVVAILLVTILLFWRINRINNKRREAELIYQKKLQQERDRLSRDLHDNAGSLISFVGAKVDWIVKNKTIETDLKEDLKSIQDHSKKIMEGLRETLWTLNSRKITNLELADKLKPYIKTHLLIPFKMEDKLEKEQELESELVLNIYRCCQEIINNLHKHSQADKVEIEFSEDENNRFIIQIKDNGVGIKKEDLEKENHFGLRNMKARLDEVNAKIIVENPKEGGTMIKIFSN